MITKHYLNEIAGAVVIFTLRKKVSIMDANVLLAVTSRLMLFMAAAFDLDLRARFGMS